MDEKTAKELLEFASISEMITTTTNSSNFRFDKDMINQYLSNPYRYSQELRNVSDDFYHRNGIYKNIMNAFASLPTLHNMILPTARTLSKMNDKSYTTYLDKLNAFKDSIDIPVFTRSILKSVARYGGYIGYERSLGNEFVVQSLNLDYCRVRNKIGHDWEVEFNFKFFDKFFNKDDLDFAWKVYPPEFKKLYNRYKADTKSRSPEWQPLDIKKTYCVLFDDDEPFFIPIFSGMFDSLLNNEEYKDLIKAEQILDTTKLVVQKLPMGEDGSMFIPKDVSSALHRSLVKSLPSNVNAITTPFDIKDVPFSNQGKTKEELLAKAERGAFVGSGWNSAMFADSGGHIGLNINIEVVTSVIYSILEKVESLFGRKFKNIVNTKTYEFKLKIFRTTNINVDESFNRMYRLLEVGGAISPLISLAGIDVESYITLLNVEDSIGIKCMLTPVNSMHTSTKSDKVGAPEKSDKDLGDAGIITRDRDDNNPDKRKS